MNMWKLWGWADLDSSEHVGYIRWIIKSYATLWSTLDGWTSNESQPRLELHILKVSNKEEGSFLNKTRTKKHDKIYLDVFLDLFWFHFCSFPRLDLRSLTLLIPTLPLLILSRANEKALRISGGGEERFERHKAMIWCCYYAGMERQEMRQQRSRLCFQLDELSSVHSSHVSYFILLLRPSNDDDDDSLMISSLNFASTKSWWRILKNETCHITLDLFRLLIVATLPGNYSWIYCFELKSRSKQANNIAQRTSWRVLMWIINYGKCPEAFSVTRTNEICILSDSRASPSIF